MLIGALMPLPAQAKKLGLGPQMDTLPRNSMTDAFMAYTYLYLTDMAGMHDVRLCEGKV